MKKRYFGKTDPRPSNQRKAHPAEPAAEPSWYHQMLRRSTASAAVACKVLGIEAAYSREQVFASYRAEQLKHHPDRGGTVLASQAINAAWSYLKAWYNW